MAHHLEHGAADSERVDGPDPQQHEAHVAHRAAGDPPFHVVLGEGIEGAIDDVHDAQHDQGRREHEVGLRQHLHVEAQQGITAHLEQHPRQQHGHRCVGLTVGIGQPGVERENRQLHAEAHQEAQITEEPEAAAGGTGGQLAEVEGEVVAGES